MSHIIITCPTCRSMSSKLWGISVSQYFAIFAHHITEQKSGLQFSNASKRSHVIDLNPKSLLHEGGGHMFEYILCVYTVCLFPCYFVVLGRCVWVFVFWFCLGFFKRPFQEILSTFEILMKRCFREIIRVWVGVTLVLHLVVHLWTRSTSWKAPETDQYYVKI